MTHFAVAGGFRFGVRFVGVIILLVVVLLLGFAIGCGEVVVRVEIAVVRLGAEAFRFPTYGCEVTEDVCIMLVEIDGRDHFVGSLNNEGDRSSNLVRRGVPLEQSQDKAGEFAWLVSKRILHSKVETTSVEIMFSYNVCLHQKSSIPLWQAVE